MSSPFSQKKGNLGKGLFCRLSLSGIWLSDHLGVPFLLAPIKSNPIWLWLYFASSLQPATPQHTILNPFFNKIKLSEWRNKTPFLVISFYICDTVTSSLYSNTSHVGSFLILKIIRIQLYRCPGKGGLFVLYYHFQPRRIWIMKLLTNITQICYPFLERYKGWLLK